MDAGLFLRVATLAAMVSWLGGCASVVSRFVASPVPSGLERHEGEGFVIHTDLTPAESAVVATYLQEARAECDRLFGVEVSGDLDVYIFRHGDESSGRWRYAVSLPTGAIHIGYHYALRRGAPPLRLEDLQNGILGDTLRHEVSHQHLYRVLGRLPRMPWLYEGLPMLVESVSGDRVSGRVSPRPSRSVHLEVARWVEDGLTLLPEHVIDMGWQDFYNYAEHGTYSVAATVVDLLHAEAGRPADLGAFCRDLVSRRKAGTLPDPGFRERWRRHVRESAVLQVEHLKRDIREGSPYERIAALEVLSYTTADPRWGDGDRLLRSALVENLTAGDSDVQARTFTIALDVLAGDLEPQTDPALDLRLPIARFLERRHAGMPGDTLGQWLDRLGPENGRFWDARTAATLGWALDSANPRVRRYALEVLTSWGGPEHLERFAEEVAEGDPAFTRLAMRAMVGVARERAVRILEPCLDSEVPRLRESAVLALAELRDPRARGPALAMASTEGHPFLGWAFRALSRYPDPEIAGFLESRARARVPSGDVTALRALVWMDSADSFAALCRLFEDPKLREWVAAEMTEAGRAHYREFLAGRLPDLEYPHLALLYRLSDEQLAPHVEILRQHARRLREEFRLLESFVVRRRLAKMGVPMDDAEGLFQTLRDLEETDWAHEQQILARMAAAVDPARTVAILVDRLSGGLSERKGAIRCLHHLTGQSLDFHWAAPRSYREASLQAWREWAKSQGAALRWDDSRGRMATAR